jgi:hypothetical protein
LIDAASNLQARAILMLLYSTGVRRSELARLRVEDIASSSTSCPKASSGFANSDFCPGHSAHPNGLSANSYWR